MKVTAARNHRGRFGLIEAGVEYDTATDANIVRALEERPNFFVQPEAEEAPVQPEAGEDEGAPVGPKKRRSGARKATTVAETTDDGAPETR